VYPSPGRLLTRLLAAALVLGSVGWLVSPLGALAQIRDFQLSACIIEVPAGLPPPWLKVKTSGDEYLKLDLSRYTDRSYRLSTDDCYLFSLLEDPKQPGIYLVESIEEGGSEIDPHAVETEEPKD
jgi:hypothetical protein